MIGAAALGRENARKISSDRLDRLYRIYSRERHSSEFKGIRNFSEAEVRQENSIRRGSDWGEYSIGEIYKTRNGWICRCRHWGQDGESAVFRRELQETIVNLDVIMCHYQSVLWHDDVPSPLIIKKEGTYFTNRMSFVSGGLEHFKPDLIESIVEEFCSSMTNSKVRFIGKTGTRYNKICELEEDVEYILDSTHGTRYQKIEFQVECDSRIDRMKVYRLKNLLHSTGWNDDDRKFRNFVEINRGNLFAVSDTKQCISFKENT